MDFENKDVNETEEINTQAEVDSDEITEETDVISEEESTEDDVKKKNIKKEIMDWVISIVLAVIIALVIRNYIFTLVRVDGDSMNTTLAHGDTLYTHRLFYEPKNGDIIIFNPRNAPEKAYVKRVIAVEGQSVFIDPASKTVSVDGQILDEPYINGAATYPGNAGTSFVVPEDHVFVLGDNRMNSSDSRNFEVGYVSEDSIIGKAVFRLLPFSSFGMLK